MFQFPSNGKGGSKRLELTSPIAVRKPRSFNSLQTGKGVARVVLELEISNLYRFNSLQTGKGVARLQFKVHLATDACSCFNSLQTGKGVASDYRVRYLPLHLKFQFPSNGKRGSKFQARLGMDVSELGFNSLQTGKGVASESRLVSFNKGDPVSIPFKREKG